MKLTNSSLMGSLAVLVITNASPVLAQFIGSIDPYCNQYSLNEYVLFMACDKDGAGEVYSNNWMDLRECLGFNGTNIIPQDQGNFYHEIDSVASGEMSCFMCDLNNKLCPSATCMTCLCLNADGVDVDASLELNNQGILRDENGNLFCFMNRASIMKVRPTYAAAMELAMPTQS